MDAIAQGRDLAGFAKVGRRHTFRQKIFWFREGYSWRRDPQARLEITRQRVDSPATSNGWNNDAEHPLIVSVIDLLRLGSWKITGHYEDGTLSFVEWRTE
jgi:hypothetical protein